MMPVTPATPNPGRTNTSMSTSTSPRMNSSAPSTATCPLNCVCAQKTRMKQSAATMPGTVVPGTLSSSIRPVKPMTMSRTVTGGMRKKLANRSSHAGVPSLTLAGSMPYLAYSSAGSRRSVVKRATPSSSASDAVSLNGTPLPLTLLTSSHSPPLALSASYSASSINRLARWSVFLRTCSTLNSGWSMASMSRGG